MTLRQVDSQCKIFVKHYEESKSKLRRFVPSQMCAGATGEKKNHRDGGGLDEEVCNTSRTASAVAVSPVMCSGLPIMGNVNGVGTSPLQPRVKLASRYER